ncbi:MAG: hypothetical protein II139_08265, partial [Lachnospiraceae bacterium]|nr:hypothetical protein [Lachnospiraceae bacterium]
MNSWNLERKCRKAALAVALWVAVGMLCGCGSREDKAEDTLATQECEESSISSEVLVDPDQVMQYGREVYLGKDASTEGSMDPVDSSAQATKGYE